MTTLTQPLEFSILCAPLGAIDPRALSQAWRSALGERPRGARTAPLGRCAAVSGTLGSPVQGAARSPLRPSRRPVSAAPSHASRAHRAGRAATSEWVKERTTVRPTRPRSHAPRAPIASRTTVRVDGGRVHVLVQSASGTLRVVAICKPELRDRVARALAQARQTLAARGIVVSAVAKEAAPCT